MYQVYKTLPDDRPITCLCVVEDPEKCPKGFKVISKTYDQDSDADLWRESGFFGRKCMRYLCLSKTEGIKNCAVQSLCIINEKDPPVQGYEIITKTADTQQKAWRKKQLYYKNAQLSNSDTFITDIIVLGRMKKAPDGFLFSGEINGMVLCYKIKKNIIREPLSSNHYHPKPYSLTPLNCHSELDGWLQNNYQNPAGNSKNLSQDSNVEEIRSLVPFRPAPKPPISLYATLSGYNGLEGVPFILNPKYHFSVNSFKGFMIPKLKTISQIEEEYTYEFRIEHEI